jgi:sulfoxide reductase heme-binding subunit YedZ
MPAWTFAGTSEALRRPGRGAVRGARVAVFLLALLPLALMLYDIVTGELGVNPVENLLHRSGYWALRLLLVSLAIAPLRRLTGAGWLIRLRRMLGLYAFFYAYLHFMVFVVFEHSLDPLSVAEDIAKRPFILAGFVALVLMVPLAITSTNGMMRRLGGRWKKLHRLVYPIAVLAALHFLMLIKSDDLREPLIYALVLAVLLAARLPLRRMLRI